MGADLSLKLLCGEINCSSGTLRAIAAPEQARAAISSALAALGGPGQPCPAFLQPWEAAIPSAEWPWCNEYKHFRAPKSESPESARASLSVHFTSAPAALGRARTGIPSVMAAPGQAQTAISSALEAPGQAPQAWPQCKKSQKNCSPGFRKRPTVYSHKLN